MPDALTLSERERLTRAKERAHEIFNGACALHSRLARGTDGQLLSFRSCMRAAETEYDALLQRCISAEPVIDPKEFGSARMPDDE